MTTNATAPVRLSFAGAALWSPERPESERMNQQKRRVVASMPGAIRHCAISLPETVKKRASIWLESLVLEQLAAEWIVKHGGRVMTMIPAIVESERDRLALNKCGRLVHRWNSVHAAFLGIRPTTAPDGWDALSITCQECRRDVSSYFLIERDVEAGRWLRMTFAPGMEAGPVRVNFADQGGGSVIVGGYSPNYHLAPGLTLEIPHVLAFTTDARTNPATRSRRYVAACPFDTDGNGNCGREFCIYCGNDVEDAEETCVHGKGPGCDQCSPTTRRVLL